MYDIVMELFESFGLDRMPETFAELIPWLIAVFVSLSIVIYFFDMMFIIVKSINGRGKGL